MDSWRKLFGYILPKEETKCFLLGWVLFQNPFFETDSDLLIINRATAICCHVAFAKFVVKEMIK